jgi:hypothetical protein
VAVCDVTPITVRQFFVGLQHRSASHQHQAFRTLRTRGCDLQTRRRSHLRYHKELVGRHLA